MSVYLHIIPFIPDERIAHKGLGSQRTLHSHDEGEQRLMNSRCTFGAVFTILGKLDPQLATAQVVMTPVMTSLLLMRLSYSRDKVELCLI